MQKRIVRGAREHQPANGPWLDLERLVQVELTSEDAAHPVEAALLPSGGPGWRAAEHGEQTIRLLFREPHRLRRIWLRFVEAEAERTQEFVLRWSPDGQSFRDVVRQQYTFGPAGATSEVEDLAVELASVSALELTIIPDQGRGRAYASLAEWRIA
jgi:hypothetical protein